MKTPAESSNCYKLLISDAVRLSALCTLFIHPVARINNQNKCHKSHRTSSRRRTGEKIAGERKKSKEKRAMQRKRRSVELEHVACEPQSDCNSERRQKATQLESAATAETRSAATQQQLQQQQQQQEQQGQRQAANVCEAGYVQGRACLSACELVRGAPAPSVPVCV